MDICEIKKPSNKGLEYWQASLSECTNLKFPAVIQTSKKQKIHQSVSFDFDQSTTQSMQEFARQHNTNLFAYIYFGLVSALIEVSGQDRVTLSTLSCPEKKEALPPEQDHAFTRLVLCHRHHPKLSFNEQYQAAALNVLTAYEHRDIALDKLLNQIVQPRTNPFQIVLVLLDEKNRNMLYLPCKETAQVPFPYHDACADLSFSLQLTEQGLNAELYFNASICNVDLAKKIVQVFEQKLKAPLEEWAQ